MEQNNHLYKCDAKPEQKTEDTIPCFYIKPNYKFVIASDPSTELRAWQSRLYAYKSGIAELVPMYIGIISSLK